MIQVTINDRWPLQVTEHRALRWVAAESQQIGYERQRLMAMSLHIRPTDTIFDIGAEQGDLSALFASWVPDGRVVLVEPCAENWPSIRATFNYNDLPTPAGTVAAFCGAGVVNAAALTHLGDAWPDETEGSTLPEVGYATRTPDSTTTTIDAMTTMFGPPDVITIDVEGDELAVLQGAQRTLSGYRPHVFVSVHPQFTGGTERRPANVYDLLESAGYRLWFLGADHEIHIHAEPRS